MSVCYQVAVRSTTKFRRDVLLFVLVALTSLVLDSACDRFLQRLMGDSHAWIRTLHLLPLVISVALYLACGPGDSWKLPRGEIKHGWLVFPIWAALAGAVFGLMVLVDKDVSSGQIAIRAADFMVVHVIAMELLFRGALVALAGRVWPPTSLDRDGMSFQTMLVVSLVFGLSQLQYNQTLLASAPWWQALRAAALGLFMCFGRAASRSIWGAALVHAGSNFLGALR